MTDMIRFAFLKDHPGYRVEGGLEEGKSRCKKNRQEATAIILAKSLMVAWTTVMIVGMEESGRFMRNFKGEINDDRCNEEWETVEAKMTPRSQAWATDSMVVPQNKKGPLKVEEIQKRR